VYNNIPERVFAHRQELREMGLAAPQVSGLMERLKAVGFGDYPYLIREEEAVQVICSWFLGHGASPKQGMVLKEEN